MSFLGNKISPFLSLMNASSRTFHVSAVKNLDAVKQWVYNRSIFNQYGLMRDDVREETDPDVQEALKRLPDNVMQERNWRQLRAHQLVIQGEVLPKDEWTKLEEDVWYLKPYIEQVKRERLEKEAWNREH